MLVACAVDASGANAPAGDRTATVLAESHYRKTADTLYRRAILRDGTPDKTIARLQETALGPQAPPSERSLALLIVSDLNWRHGRVAQALKAVEQALETCESVDAILQHAQILEATGEEAQARDRYRQALRVARSAGQQATIRLRLAIAQPTAVRSSGDDGGDTATFVRAMDPALQHRVAVALGALGHYEVAIDLAGAIDADALPGSDRMRLIEWAIRTNHLALAQEHAWKLVRGASDREVRLYGLSLLVEAYRMGGSLEALGERLLAQDTVAPEARGVLIDLLREQKRYAQALSLVQNDLLVGSSADRRYQLVSIYREAGNESGVIARYHELIGREPAEIDWRGELAELYVARGEIESATRTWLEFFADNRENLQVLMRGARTLMQSDLYPIAVDGLEAYMQQHGAAPEILLLLFDGHRQRGEVSAAEEALRRLDAHLAADAVDRKELAEAYERLNRPDRALAIWESLAQAKGVLDADEAMRLARLYDKLGEKEKALRTWLSLRSRLSNSNRRNFAQDRVVALAVELNRLEDVASALRQKLANGTADASDVALLARVYAAGGDRTAARRTIDKFYAKRDSARIVDLREQAAIYRTLSEHDAYIAVMRQLAKIDSRNRANYLMGIILSHIERLDADPLRVKRIADVHQLLLELREAKPGADAWEFEASVLVLAGYVHEATELYRRVIAYNPERGDVYLAMADLMKKRGRKEEAIAMLQHLIVTTDDDDLFVAAADGIVNVVDGGVHADDRGLLVWLQRRIAERLAERPNRWYLYRILATVAEELGDEAARVSALENALAVAGERRGAALRELFALTAAFDRDRHLAYGRRLLALQVQLPPETHLDIGKALLGEGDLDGAARAFDQAKDLSGRTDIQERAGDLYADAGFYSPALNRYRQALRRDNSNISLIHKLARVVEITGPDQEAHQQYGKALHVLLLRQPTMLHSQQSTRARMVNALGGSIYYDSTVTRDFREHYEDLVQGYLTTWPNSRAAAERELASFEELVSRELESVVGNEEGHGSLGDFSRHARLFRICEFVRRVAFARGYWHIADRMDAQLLKHFGHDVDWATRLVIDRLEMGLHRSAHMLAEAAGSDQVAVALRSALDGISPDARLSFETAMRAADISKSYTKALNISLLGNDQRQRLMVAQGWADTGRYFESMSWSKSHLDRESFAKLCRFVFQKMRSEPAVYDRLVQDHPDTVQQIETVTGERVVTDAEALRRIAVGSHVARYYFAAPYLVERLPTAAVVESLHHLMSFGNDEELAWAFRGFWPAMLVRPIDPARADATIDVLVRLLARAAGHLSSVDELRALEGRLIVPHARPDNLQVATAVIDKFWSMKNVPQNGIWDPLVLLRSGSVVAALDAFIELHVRLSPFLPDGIDADVPSSILGVDTFLDRLNEVFLPEYAPLLEQRLRVMQEQTDFIAQVSDLRYRWFYSGEQVDNDALIEFLERIVELLPSNVKYLSALYIAYYRKSGTGLNTLRVARRLNQVDPADIYYQVLLSENLAATNNPMIAQGEDGAWGRSAAELIDELLTRSAPTMRASAALFSAFDHGPIRRNQAAPSAVDGPHKYVAGIVAAVNAQAPAELRRNLRALLRSGYTDSGSLDEAAAHVIYTLHWPVQGGSALPRRLLDVTTDHDVGVEELERHLSSLSLAARSRWSDLYEYLAAAYLRRGVAERTIADLEQAAGEGQIDDHRFTLWVTLMARIDGRASKEALSTLDRAIERGWLSPYQLTMIARVYARAGQQRSAAAVYRRLMVQVLNADGSSQADASVDSGRYTAEALIEEVSRNLTGKHRQQVVEEVLRLSRPLPTDSFEKSHRTSESYADRAEWRVSTAQPSALERASERYGVSHNSATTDRSRGDSGEHRRRGGPNSIRAVSARERFAGDRPRGP